MSESFKKFIFDLGITVQNLGHYGLTIASLVKLKLQTLRHKLINERSPFLSEYISGIIEFNTKIMITMRIDNYYYFMMMMKDFYFIPT